jgi:protein NirF
MSSRDDNKVVIFDTATKQQIGGFDAASPSGIFFTTRAARTGF